MNYYIKGLIERYSMIINYNKLNLSFITVVITICIFLVIVVFLSVLSTNTINNDMLQEINITQVIDYSKLNS